MDTTTLLEATGGDGAFQAIMVLITQSIRLVTLWSLFFMTFGIYQPPLTCSDQSPPNSTNSNGYFENRTNLPKLGPRNIGLNNFTNFMENGFFNRSTNSFWKRYNSTEGIVEINGTNEDACVLFDTCANISFASGSSTVVSEWRLVCGYQWIGPLIISLQMVGFVFGSFFGGQAGESIGRKRALYLSIVAMSCLTIVSNFSMRWEIFATIRFITGICNGSIFTLCVVYCVEFLGPKGRTALKIIPVFGLGAGTSSLVAFIVRDWRLLNYVTGAASGLLCLSAFWAPESIRWLYVNGKMDIVRRVAHKINKLNTGKKGPPDINLEELSKRENKQSSDHRYSYLDLFRGRHQCRITVSITAVWIIRYLVHFMLGFGVKAFSGDFYVNLLIYSFCEVPVFIIVAPIVRFLGNRHSACLFFFVSCCASVSIVIVHHTVSASTKGTVITFLALTAKFFVSCVNQVVLVYTNELFPTVMRSLGLGIANGVGMVGGAVAPFLIPNTPGAFPVNFTIVSVLQFLTCVVLLTLPETKEKPLEDFAKRGVNSGNVEIVAEFPNKC